MISFPIFDFSTNVGGNQYFKFSPVSNISLFPPEFINKITHPVVFKSECSWFYGYSSAKTLLFEEIMGKNPHGSFFNIKISGFYPKLSNISLANFIEMQNGLFVVLIKDNNGFLRLVGSIDNPLEFSYSPTTGSNATMRNGVNFEFTGIYSQPSPFYLSEP